MREGLYQTLATVLLFSSPLFCYLEARTALTTLSDYPRPQRDTNFVQITRKYYRYAEQTSSSVITSTFSRVPQTITNSILSATLLNTSNCIPLTKNKNRNCSVLKLTNPGKNIEFPKNFCIIVAASSVGVPNSINCRQYTRADDTPR